MKKFSQGKKISKLNEEYIELMNMAADHNGNNFDKAIETLALAYHTWWDGTQDHFADGEGEKELGMSVEEMRLAAKTEILKYLESKLNAEDDKDDKLVGKSSAPIEGGEPTSGYVNQG